jgi:flagellar protein FliO/FliZ
MTQSLVLIGLFMAALVCMPWAVDRLKKRYGRAPIGPAGESRLVNVLAVGPHQKVVTVEVGPSDARVWLVLGVTQQSIQCLHRLPLAHSSDTSQVPQHDL